MNILIRTKQIMLLCLKTGMDRITFASRKQSENVLWLSWRNWQNNQVRNKDLQPIQVSLLRLMVYYIKRKNLLMIITINSFIVSRIIFIILLSRIAMPTSSNLVHWERMQSGSKSALIIQENIEIIIHINSPCKHYSKRRFCLPLNFFEFMAFVNFQDNTNCRKHQDN